MAANSNSLRFNKDYIKLLKDKAALAVNAVGSIDLVADAAQAVTLTAKSFVVSARQVFTPSATQVLVAATAVSPNATVVRVSAASNITLSATPMITTTGAVDGQQVRVMNVGANTITLSDNGTVANSKLRLSATTIVLGQYDSVTFEYVASAGFWVQVAQVNIL